MAKKIPRDLLDEAIRLLDAKKTYAEVSKITGICTATLCDESRMRGIDRRTRYTKAQLDKAMKMLDSHTLIETVTKTGISRSKLVREKARRDLEHLEKLVEV